MLVVDYTDGEPLVTSCESHGTEVSPSTSLSWFSQDSSRLRGEPINTIVQ
jgi:hypothetical protein